MFTEIKVKAKYKGPEHPAFNKDEEYDLIILTQGESPELEVTTKQGQTSVMYPSKKKYLEHWDEIEGTKSAKAYQPKSMSGKKVAAPKEVSIADAGGVIYTQIIDSIKRFNGKTAHTYSEDESGKKAVFEVRLEQQIYDEATQKKTKLYGAGVLILEIKQFGLKRILWQQGVSFYTKKELDNINAYAPKLYMALLDGMVESALLFALSLTPDDPENLNELNDGKPAIKKAARKKKPSADS